MLDRIVEKTADVLQTVTGVLLLLLFTLNILQISMRYIAGIAWLWLPDVSRLLFVWVVFIGASVLVARNEHLLMDFFSAKFHEAAARRLAVATQLAQIAFFATMLFAGVRITRVRMRIPYDTFDLPSGWAYMAVPVCGAIMMLFSVSNIRKSFGAKEKT
jgi:TRAP-type C4-dicarboxylate transport system permease small subunit